MNLNYDKFLQTKIAIAKPVAEELGQLPISDKLSEHSQIMARWLLKRGRGLLAASFGMHKTRTQCGVAKALHEHTGQKFLLVCPLAVRHQFMQEDGPELGMDWQYCTTDQEVEQATSPYIITNYERVRDGGITPAKHNLCGASLDEGSVLRSLGSKTCDVFEDLFADVPNKYVCTATPSPNNFKEIIYYAHFLGVMDRGQCLTRFFQRNPDKAGDLTLIPEHEESFWLWVASWALFLYRPSDIGCSDEGYDLPELRIHWHPVQIDHGRALDIVDDRGQAAMFVADSNSISEVAKESHETLGDRGAKMLDIMLQSISATLSTNGEEELQQSILREEQGCGEGTLPSLLSCEQGEDRSREAEGVHEGVPENLSSQEAHSGRTEGAQSKASRKVRNGRRTSRKDESQGQRVQREEPACQEESPIAQVRSNDRTIQRDIEGPRRGLCDLRSNENARVGQAAGFKPDVRGSRSHDGPCQGDSLPELQLRDRQLSRQHRVVRTGNELSVQVIVWCYYNVEQRLVEQSLQEKGISYSSVFGSLTPEEVERRLFQWMRGETTVLIAKPSMLGAGCNLQHNSHTNIYLGPSYKFQDFIQSIHRTWRFQQQHPVDVHIIYAESQSSVVRIMKQKWAQHDTLVAKMREIIKDYGLNHEALNMQLTRQIGIQRQVWQGERSILAYNDTVREAPLVESDSVGLIHTSVPFGNQYEYGINVEDFGHSESNEVYHQQMDFLIPELLRILKPGRIAAIHVKDRIRYGWQTNSQIMEVEPFSDDTVNAFRKHGFLYEGRRTIVTDVVRENNGTYRLGYTEMCKDASKMGSGLPEYLLLFRKAPTDVTTAYADSPVTKDKKEYSLARWQIDASSLWASDGRRMNDSYDYEQHIRKLEEMEAAGVLPKTFCSDPARSNNPDVWTDVNFMQGLNNKQVEGKQIKHLCPLPLDIVKRTILLYSNPGELVYDPFSGLGTVPYVAVLNGRRGYGVELNPSYYQNSIAYLLEAENRVLSPSLFQQAA